MRRMVSRGKIGVVVPALNEERNIARLISRLKTLPDIGEIIVCDGGSADATREIATRNGALVVQTTANRGLQMNAGAALCQSALCQSEILWFLHADAFPAQSSTRSIVQAAHDSKIVGGNFRLRFDRRSRGAHLVENIARVLRRCGVYYGDSGIWMRREAFDALGGFQPWPLFEDFDMARRLESYARSQRKRTVCLAALTVSSRRFRGGVARLLWRWCELQWSFWRGVSPHELARRYHK